MTNRWKMWSIRPPANAAANRVGLVRLALVVWIVLVTAGFALLMVYQQSPGADIVPAEISEPNPESETWTLLVGVHPRCPCTQATVNELEHLLRRYPARLDCQALIYHPEKRGKEWLALPMVERLRDLPQVSLRGDSDGRELAALGIETSGGVRLFDPTGKLRFHGGITPSRGHRGVNMGSEIIETLLRGEPTTLDQAPVYGCRIRSSSKKDQ